MAAEKTDKKTEEKDGLQENKKNVFGRRIMAGVSLVLLTAALLTGILFAVNRYTITFNIEENEEETLEYGQDQPTEVTAVLKGSIFHRKGLEVPVTIENAYNPQILGDYTENITAVWKRTSASVSRTIHVRDHNPPVITLVSDPDHFTSPIAHYEEEGYSAEDNYDGDLTEEVVSEEKDGKVTYTVSDSSGNETTVVREIIYKDVVPPVITLKGEAEMTWECGTEFKDPGYEAKDDCDGDITGQVSVSGSADTSKTGSFTLTYTVQDSYENVCEATRKVTVEDTTAPELTLAGDSSVYVLCGSSYKEAGYSAKDTADGDLTSSVAVSGSPDTSSVGVYTLTYQVSDAAGNTAKASRTVYVYRKQTAAQTKDPGNKVVYLTFDDGPYKYTGQLLDVLDKYGVKATFFVTNQFSSYQYLIGEEASRGHTVAIHSYSHEYSDIYSSEENYFADLKKMSDICEKQTGKAPTILRFPGGSSNGVSKKYCTGIMTRLTESVEKMGYQYCDWNVLSGDAGETTSTAVVKQNVIDGISKHNVSVVLQHDIQGFSVDAVEDIIVWGLANGYTFLPLTDSSPMVHHSVNN